MARESNLSLCYTLILAGALIMFATVVAALYLKNGIIERTRDAPSFESISDIANVDMLNMQIRIKDSEIEMEKNLPEPEEERRKNAEYYKRLNKNIQVNRQPLFVRDDAKIKRLEEEKQKLVEKRDALLGKTRATNMKPQTWGEWFDEYELGLFLGGVFPLGLFALTLLRFLIGAKLPARNPLSLTDLERRCVLFVPFSIVFSAFGFFVFVWILSISY